MSDPVDAVPLAADPRGKLEQLHATIALKIERRAAGRLSSSDCELLAHEILANVARALYPLEGELEAGSGAS